MFGESILSGLVSGLTNGLFATYGIQEQGRQNEALAAQQNDYNLDMWKMQNEYNSPQAQMQRLSAAGLNPNLMYGMGNTGNSSQAPQKTAPAPVDYQKYGQELAKAFNLENLRTVVAHRRQEEAKARVVETDAKTAEDTYKGYTALGNHLVYDPSNGRFTFDTPYQKYINNGELPGLGFYKVMSEVANNYHQNELIPFRQKLLGSQNSYLQPQIWMQNYEKQHYPVSYWIGQGGKFVHSVGEFSRMFNPRNYIMPFGRQDVGYFSPFGKKYY